MPPSSLGGEETCHSFPLHHRPHFSSAQAARSLLAPSAACSLPAAASTGRYFSTSALQKYQIFPPVPSYTRSLFSPKKRGFLRAMTHNPKKVGCLRLQVSAACCSAHLNQPKRGEGSKKCSVPQSRRGTDLTAGLPYKHPSQGPLWDPHTCGVHPSVGSLLPRKADLRCRGPWWRQSQVCWGLCHSWWVLGEQRYPTAGHGWVPAPQGPTRWRCPAAGSAPRPLEPPAGRERAAC